VAIEGCLKLTVFTDRAVKREENDFRRAADIENAFSDGSPSASVGIDESLEVGLCGFYLMGITSALDEKAVDIGGNAFDSEIEINKGDRMPRS
jgi:hypothetical protein